MKFECIPENVLWTLSARHQQNSIESYCKLIELLHNFTEMCETFVLVLRFGNGESCPESDDLFVYLFYTFQYKSFSFVVSYSKSSFVWVCVYALFYPDYFGLPLLSGSLFSRIFVQTILYGCFIFLTKLSWPIEANPSIWKLWPILTSYDVKIIKATPCILVEFHVKQSDIYIHHHSGS